MKWVLLILAGFSLWVCWQLGQLAYPVEVKQSQGYTAEYSSAAAAAAADIAAGYTGGTIGAGLIGTAAALGAALIQASENKHKE